MRKTLPVTTPTLILTACGGGGGGDNAGNPEAVSGLSLPSALSVIVAPGNNGAKALKASAVRDAPVSGFAFGDAGTDYSNDTAQDYLYDASMEPLEPINELLCLLDQTRSDDMVNKGPYIAMVNTQTCKTGGLPGTKSGKGNIQTDPLNRWTVVSSRPDNSSAQTIKIWAPADPVYKPLYGQDLLIEINVTEGPGTTVPFGRFTLNYETLVDGTWYSQPSGTQVTVTRGALQSETNAQGKPRFRFVSLSGNALDQGIEMYYADELAANVLLDDTGGTSGRAHSAVKQVDSNVTTRSIVYATAYDAGHLLRGEDIDADQSADATRCKSRTTPDTHSLQYKLYHALDGSFNGRAVTAGQRVKLITNQTFNFDSNNDGTEDGSGSASLFGVYAYTDYTEVALADGTAVTLTQSPDSPHTGPAALAVSPGLMTRKEVITEPLAGYRGYALDLPSDYSHPTLAIKAPWVVTVDANNDFNIIGVRAYPDLKTHIDHDNDPNTADVAVAAALSLNNGDLLSLRDITVERYLQYSHDVNTAAADRILKHDEYSAVVLGTNLLDTGALTLYCYDKCLKGGLAQSDIDAAANIDALYHSYANTPLQYTLNRANNKIQLTDNGNADAVVTLDGLDLRAFEGTLNVSFIGTGPLLVTPLTDPTQPLEVYNQPLTYDWYAGAHDSNAATNANQLITVLDAQGNEIIFDQTLKIPYTHSTANDTNGNSTHDGTPFGLQYDAILYGLPWYEDTETHRLYPTINLKDGTALSDGSNNFVTKAIDNELTLRDDTGACTALDIAPIYTDAELSLPTAADTSALSFTLADKPVITTPPAVIEGVLQ